MTIRSPSGNVFEIGLVMAGAASAGAYTAGVVDYLIEALQAWEEAKLRGDPDIPDHETQIRVAAGASAGGIVAAMLGMLPFTGHFPMRDLAGLEDAAAAQNADLNLLYRCWVRDVDLRDMLVNDDLVGEGRGVPSLLNGRVLAAAADRAVASTRAAASIAGTPPRFFANPLQLYLCFTNMQGLSYEISMIADETMRGHRVRSHADYGHFAVFGAGSGEAEPLPPGAIAIGSQAGAAGAAADGWDLLRDAGLATSAFPGGFPARPFRNPMEAYRHRGNFGPAAEIGGGGVSVSLKLPSHVSASYDFWSVDGGLLDNEPLQYARMALNGSPHARAVRDSRRADRAVLLVDPFPSDLEALPAAFGACPDLLDSLLRVVPILRDHVAFKPQDLILALADDIRSRFLIAPIRETMQNGEMALASAGLSGFAGFVDERLRMHDFQLGRRNCQKFLRDHFSVHVENPIVAGWVERLRRRPGALDRYFGETRRADGRVVKDPTMVQVVPLMDAVRPEVPLLAWPKLDRELHFTPLRRLIEGRAEAIVPEIVRSLLVRLGVDDHRLLQRALEAVACKVITHRVAASTCAALERDLTTRNLMV